MSASSARGLLTLATRGLMARWDETRLSWRDAKAAEFDAVYLSEVGETVSAALRTLEEIDQLLERVHADCE